MKDFQANLAKPKKMEGLDGFGRDVAVARERLRPSASMRDLSLPTYIIRRWPLLAAAVQCSGGLHLVGAEQRLLHRFVLPGAAALDIRQSVLSAW